MNWCFSQRFSPQRISLLSEHWKRVGWYDWRRGSQAGERVISLLLAQTDPDRWDSHWDLVNIQFSWGKGEDTWRVTSWTDWGCLYRFGAGTQSRTGRSLKEIRFQRRPLLEKRIRIEFCLKENHFQHRQPRGMGSRTAGDLQHHSCTPQEWEEGSWLKLLSTYTWWCREGPGCPHRSGQGTCRSRREDWGSPGTGGTRTRGTVLLLVSNTLTDYHNWRIIISL